MKLPNKIYSTAAIFTLIALLLVVFLIYPTFRDIKHTSQEIVSGKEKTAFLYQQNKELDDFKKKYKDYEANLGAIDQLFIDPKNPVDFIKFLESTSSRLNVALDINVITGAKKESPAGSSDSSFQIYARGNFANVLKFAEQMETGPYLLVVKSLSIGKLTQEEGKEAKPLPGMVGAHFVVEVVTKPL